ncbi:uncharacterized protein MYCFIDRAFT_77984 [Pseudocercospora fijiensis CIRAD86]|uniref:Transcription factor domain-containing protein n=1 Tax=Pseudocercospora fijiensis (strain CIRAD86) TaxID=383855 RepID=M2YR92_PSEFD|nr:uncharacterized protein MYCFIDRAFT_77984 [Pseudocercospora fijiensis CIRAD86]EME80220.1 hypothetical protein MYCFIDRAFT_77984 [Pseudocercospora fijiensis CIRAD86]
MQHYEKALSSSVAAHDLLSDGVFFRHFLLFVYDICIPTRAGDDNNTNMWAGHLTHLRLLAIQRHQLRGHEAHAYSYTLWTICQLDMYACLMGSGACEFVETITRNNMLPPLEHQIPPVLSPGTSPFHPHEELQIFPAILHLHEGIILLTAKLAQTAHNFRTAIKSPSSPIPPSTYAQWQATTSSLQNDLHTFWQQASHPITPSPADSLAASTSLPPRVRPIFETSLLLYHAATIYSRTSMFPNQRHIPSASQHDINADTEVRAQAILHLVQNQAFACRDMVFPVFMAGVASADFGVQMRAVELMKEIEGEGIGGNIFRLRVLLGEVEG